MTTQAPRVGGRECPVGEGTPDHCKATTRPGHLMCSRHWAHVPVEIRSEVWGTWRAWQRTSTDVRWDAYMAARQKALDVFTKTQRAELPSEGLEWDDLDAASLVVVVAPDGSSRMWWESREFALIALTKMWEQIATLPAEQVPAHDVRL